MTKKNFISLIMSTGGGIFFALGMCMCLLPAWGVRTQGIIVAAVGAAVLLAMLFVRRKMGGKPVVRLNKKTVGTVCVGIAGSLILGAGMCLTMIWNMMIPGILVGIVGILALLCLIHLIKGLK